MHTNTRPVSALPSTAAVVAQRRRRHLSVYRKALGSAKTPQQRAAIAARYRHLFALDASAPTGTVTQLLLGENGLEYREMPIAPQATDSELSRQRRAVELSESPRVDADFDRQCRAENVSTATEVPRSSTGNVERLTVTVAA